MGINLGGVLSSYQPTSWSLAEKLSGGWSASLGFGQWFNTRSISAESTASITVIDHRGISLVSPTMLIGPRDRNHSSSRTVGLELLDRTSWKLGDGSKSWDTFLGGTAADIIAAVADECDVTLTGAPTFPIYQEDFKLVNGWNPVDRVRKVAAMEYTVETTDALTFRAWNWTSGSCPFKPGKGGVKDRWDPLARYGRLFASKNLGLGTSSGPQHYDFTAGGSETGELHWPLMGGTPTDGSTVGSVAWVGLWDGPPEGAGKLISLHALNGDEVDGIGVPINGTWPATHYSCIVYPSKTNPSLPVQARLTINGTPYNPLPAGIEGAIAKEYGSGRGAPYAFSDSMIPTEAFAASHDAGWLAIANRGTNTLTATGPLDCRCRVGQTWGWPPFGLSGRVEQVAHSQGGRGAPQTQIVVNCDI